MQKKTKSINFRFDEQTFSELESESERTGKTHTKVIEDLLGFRRIFSDEGEAAVSLLAQRHELPRRKVIEFAVMKAAGIGDKLPFNQLAASH